MSIYDVIVVGMGPGGSTAARRLASKGLQVLALDKSRFPRYKSCGGCVSAKVDTIDDLDFSSVIEGMVSGITFTYKFERPIKVHSDKPIGHNVMRDRFDALLLEQARSRGAEVIEGVRVKGAREEDGIVTVSTDSGETYSGRYLIGADGAGGSIGRDYFGLKPKECAVSMTAEVPIDRVKRRSVNGDLYVDFGSVPYGYSWIFPKKEYLSIGFAVEAERAKGGVRRFMNELVTSHELLKGVDLKESVGWSIPLYYSSNQSVVKGRAVAIGDAGHLVDPFLGEGIYFAMKSGERAAEVIARQAEQDSGDLSAYQEVVEREFYPEFDAALKLSRLVYNYPRMWYKTLEGDNSLMERYYDVIRGSLSYREFYGWAVGRLKSKPWKLASRWVGSRFLPK
ncbi:MAG: geranylgeranyl reductase family protein [Thermodesulfobacteriota bacterium]